MRSIKLLKTAFMLGMASLSLATYAAGGPDTFMNGQSYYGEPTTQVAAVATRWREDDVANAPATERLLANAPARDDDLFLVPKIID